MEKAFLSPTLALPVLAVLLMWVFCLVEKVMMQTGCPGLGKPTTQKNLHPHSYFLYPHFLWPWIPGPHAYCIRAPGDVGWVGSGFSCHPKQSPFPLPSISKVLLVRVPNSSQPFSFISQLHLQAEQIIELITPHRAALPASI